MKKFMLVPFLAIFLAAGCNTSTSYTQPKSIAPPQEVAVTQAIQPQPAQAVPATQTPTPAAPKPVSTQKPITAPVVTTPLTGTTPVPSAPQTSPVAINPLCDKTKVEFAAFTTEYKYLNSLSGTIIQTFNSLPALTGSALSDFEQAYQRNLAQREGFMASLNQLDAELQKVPSLSFDQDDLITFKQMYSNGSTGYRNALDLKLAALKIVVDNPKSISALDSAMTMNKDYITKAAYAKNYFAGGSYYYNLLAQAEGKVLAAANQCQ